MKIINILKIAYRSLGRNKLRSFLTMLGIIIGVAAVIAMLAIGQGASNAVKAQIASLGTNMLIVFPARQTKAESGRKRRHLHASRRTTQLRLANSVLQFRM